MRAKCIVAEPTAARFLTPLDPPVPPPRVSAGASRSHSTGAVSVLLKPLNQALPLPGRGLPLFQLENGERSMKTALPSYQQLQRQPFPLPARHDGGAWRGTAGHGGARQGTALSRRRFPRFPQLCWHLALGTAARLPPRSAVILASLLPVHVK